MVMNTPQPRGRRILDGPIRRQVVPAPSAAADATFEVQPALMSEATPDVEQPTITADGTPVFEYRRPRRARWWRRVGWRKVAKFGGFGLLLVALLVGGYLAYHALMAAKNIISKSNGGAPALAGTVSLDQLKGEGDGRINVLLLGIGGQGHEGPNLSDTIVVMSIDPKTKDAAMLSIPRDLYVKLPAVANYGAQYAKINAANVYGGPEYASKVVSSVIGVPIHYYIVVDFSGFRQAVDAVGGVDINVPKAIYDPDYPCDSENGKYCPFSVKAGLQHMSGTVALRYARSRKSTNDFDRAARQQQVLAAVREKALQLSTLTNPVKLTGLIDALGGHVKTDLQPGEVTKLAGIIKDINMSQVAQKVLSDEGDDPLLVGGTNIIPAAGWVAVPKAGTYDYSEIQDFVKNIFVDHYITDENAVIEVQNGSGTSGIAGAVVKSLKAAHYNVLDAANADDHYTTTVIYDYTGGKKPYTINYLEQRFGVKAQKMAAPSPAATGTPGANTVAPEIRIILGSDYKSTQTSG